MIPHRDNAPAGAVGTALRAAFGSNRVRERALVGPLTTFGVGGPADWLVEVRGAAEVLQVMAIAHSAGVPVTVLGGGSNVLVGDGGIRGIVLRVRGGEIAMPDPEHVRADAGVTINGLVRWTVGRGFAGLESWAGTPGTVGGAIAGNAHFHGRLIGDLVETVGIVSLGGEVCELAAAEMEFGYDRSRIRRTGELVLWAIFRVTRAEPAVLRAAARVSLAYRKCTQPLDAPSAGCVFQNPDPSRDRLPPDMPPFAGALIDRAGFKGTRVGGARVSPTHANFIVNEGGATAADIRTLIEMCKRAVAEQFGVELREEIVFLGEF